MGRGLSRLPGAMRIIMSVRRGPLRGPLRGKSLRGLVWSAHLLALPSVSRVNTWLTEGNAMKKVYYEMCGRGLGSIVAQYSQASQHVSSRQRSASSWSLKPTPAKTENVSRDASLQTPRAIKIRAETRWITHRGPSITMVMRFALPAPIIHV
ncbi:hypothetical protein IWW34DRAFT_346078 [Fusarium oxysporum f. sp. albedinis]|nr:hypothetical protein IWW34DRAFT_346078 [Fusarium oxysporum f. sp. albedinis]